MIKRAIMTTINGKATIAGRSVPAMAIGTWSWGDKKWGYKEEDYAKVVTAWKACNSVGLTFYDTAEIYGEGESERIIGRLLREETDEETRKKIYIATKYLPYPRPANWFFFAPGVIAACRKSLARLGVDQIDLYQIHSSNGPFSIESTGKQLAKCVQLGLVKAVGVSNFNLSEMKRMSDTLEKEGVKLSSNQVEYSLLRRLPETSGLLKECKERGIALLAYSPLAMGRLTGKYSRDNPIPSNRKFSSQFTWDQIEPLLAEMKILGDKYGVSISAIALNWVIAKGAIPLGGARNSQQAEENAKATTFMLDEEEVAKLDSLGQIGKLDHWQHA
ncbi:NADP-dependent oxidoreductase domain-containing protein [Naematelia encephala]|uniref:NADP-dependent oxidoreductase domain-containing protein n=1 Tax=Naematelia encephala TaxID=71784 RepID=A0A1Y2BGU7_9TREE|nr:NADP-dependent oxidoreductase domain-containing protein [Naematelia encephala]